MLSVLSIPTTSHRLGRLVELNWADLLECQSAREVMLRRKLLKGLASFTDDLCAADPLCAEHHPIKDGLTLHGAACHACLFLPETSCERGNKYLDRPVLVSTVESSDLAYFTNFAEVLPTATITAETDESVPPPKPVETNLSETDELVDMCDERCQEFVRSWLKQKLPPPEVGYELPNKKGQVCAQAELAWPARKVAAVLPEGRHDQTPFDDRGWTVFDATDLTQHEAKLRSMLEG